MTTENKQTLPVTDWKQINRLRVGHHIRNRKGETGVVTWIAPNGGAYMYRLGTRELNGH